MGREIRAKIRLEGDASSAINAAKETSKAYENLGESVKGGTKAIAGAADTAARDTKSSFKGISDSVKKGAEDMATSSDKVEGRFSKLGGAIKSRALQITAAIASIAVAFRKMEQSAAVLGQSRALEASLASQGIALDGFIEKLREVSDAQVSTASLIQSSSKALLLGIPAREISQLLEIAKASAVATGTSVAQAFDDIAAGIGRNSPLILDNLGIVVKLGDAYSTLATELGKTPEQLTSAEQKQALLNEVLKVGVQRVDQFASAQSEATRQINKGRAALEDYGVSIGNALGAVALLGTAFLKTFGAGTAILLGQIAKIGEGVTSALAAGFGALGKFSDTAKEVSSELEKASKALGRTKKDLRDWTVVVAESAGEMGLAAIKLGELSLGFKTAEASVGGAAAKADEAAEDFNHLKDIVDANTDGAEDLTGAYEKFRRKLVETQTAISLTVNQFDRLVEAKGRAAAVDAALANGGRLLLGGTRIKIRGGSRLTSSPEFSTIGGGTFTTITPNVQALPDGRLVD